MIDQNTFIYQQCKQNAVKRAYAQYISMCCRIQNVARCLVAGGNPGEDPDVKDDYFYLVGQIGEDILEDVLGKEVKRIMLQIEEKEKNG